LLPKAVAIGFLMNPGSPNAAFDLSDMQAAARMLGRQLTILNASTEREIDTAFVALVQQRVAAFVIQPEPFLFSRRDQLVALASRHAIPTVYFDRAFPAAGQAGIYVGRVLKGEKPAELPVVQSTKFELVINLKTAKARGLEIPDKLLALADEVIE
jgi:putative ABC transport system substrate-binding protein